MNIQNTLKLISKHPVIFRDLGGDPKHTCMAFGIECGDGWFGLIDNLCSNLYFWSFLCGCNIIADQVKEKYGGLRFYFHCENRWYHKFTCKLVPKFVEDMVYDKIFKLVNKAERDSYTICDVCGGPGKPSESGWVTTRCNKHQ